MIAMSAQAKQIEFKWRFETVGCEQIFHAGTKMARDEVLTLTNSSHSFVLRPRGHKKAPSTKISARYFIRLWFLPRRRIGRLYQTASSGNEANVCGGLKAAGGSGPFYY